jgi:hypothetical protein
MLDRIFIRVLILAFLMIGLKVQTSFALEANDPRQSGPLDLVITYHVAPANRTAFRQMIENDMAPRFEKWRKDGVLQSYRLLFSRYVDAQGWDLMAIVHFGKYSDLAKWHAIERTMPAGLTDKALALTREIDTAPCDLFQQGAAGKGIEDHQSVFLIVPYDYLVSTNDYLRYVDGYLLPQLSGWIDEGALSSFGLFLGRYAAGRVWSSLLVLEYHGDAGLGQRDAVVAKVRQRLNANESWKAFSSDKQNIRIEKQPVIAEPIWPAQ